MNGIQDLLGKDSTASLEKVSEAEKTKDTTDNKKSKTNFNEEALLNMLMTGDNSTGLFSPNPEEIVEDKNKLHEDTTENIKHEIGETKKVSDKYSTAILEDMKKNPDKYKIQTPKGEMTIDEALKQGYNPITRKFEENKFKKQKDLLMTQLNDEDKKRVEDLSDPKNLGLAPADGKTLGLQPNSSMIRKAQPVPAEEQTVQPEQTPAAGTGIEALLGGIK